MLLNQNYSHLAFGVKITKTFLRFNFNLESGIIYFVVQNVYRN